MLTATGYPAWATEVTDIYQRYSDAPPARLRVYTATSFAAGKLATWIDRGAARDLDDMYAMAERGLITPAAARAYAQHGQHTSIPNWAFTSPPDSQTWSRDLSHQMRLAITAAEALETVRAAWQAAQG